MAKLPAGCSGVQDNYGICFTDFVELLAYPAYRPTIAALLREWLGAEVLVCDVGAEVRNSTGSPVDLKELYDALQADPQKRYAVYQAAMTLWR